MKTFKDLLLEEVSIKQFIIVKTNFPNADFWIVRKGSSDSVGKPVEKFNKEHFGVKVNNPDVIFPKFLYYALTNLFNKKYFAKLSGGTTNLVNIKKTDIENIPMNFLGLR